MTVVAEENMTGSVGLYVCAIVAEWESNSALIKCANEAQGEIQLIGQGGITAVVMVPPEDQPVSRDRQELVRQLLVHQQLVERFTEIAPVLPVKFGTLAPDRESVELGLERGREKFFTAFGGLSGKTQFEITVTWDVADVFAKIAKLPAVVKLKVDLVATSESDRPINLDRVGRLVKETLDHQRAQTGKVLLDALLPLGVDSIVNPILNDSIVLNLALLVDTDQADALDRCLDELDSTFHGALSFRCVGPMPPHSFATVEINYIEPTQVSHACCVLELDAAHNFEEIRSAYHRLARQTQQDIAPDVVVDNKSSSVGIAVLNDAYKTLLSFVDAGGPVVVSVQRQEDAYATDIPSSGG
ncbi:GvpL/GvpF-family gas vesicle protein 2 [Octadecabacter antarcticus 307]|uniref:GvpL/GvpF-family gas vesicle protein 2 n=1 Tax=Octadecabacter antarcticus 307 TaxID=391626 RepID=M9R7G5_9RHOB|nr:GvpL/GvpF family gas vesicle protein [Octadecabacter antarcticus]AGI68584.1 GvpL/GvpF-family gas vesicle protein 2 [Octadecabacter antarcticus 307]